MKYKYEGKVHDYYDYELKINKIYITDAPTRAKALSNISYRIKKDLHMNPFKTRLYLEANKLKEII